MRLGGGGGGPGGAGRAGGRGGLRGRGAGWEESGTQAAASEVCEHKILLFSFQFTESCQFLRASGKVESWQRGGKVIVV